MIDEQNRQNRGQNGKERGRPKTKCENNIQGVAHKRGMEEA